MRRMVVVSICMVLMLFAGCGMFNANAVIDPDDVTPSVITTAPLTSLWYGPLSITRYDSQTQQAAMPVTDAFYLDLKLRSDNSIIGTYTTCPTDAAVAPTDIQTYDIAHGIFEPQHQLVYLTMFANTYSSFSGDTLSLKGQKWATRNDILLANYSSVLHKIDHTSFLAACRIQPITPTGTPAG